MRCVAVFGEMRCVARAEQVWNAQNLRKKDRVTLTAMMSASLRNGRNARCLELYDAFHRFHDAVLHSIALRAAIDNNDEAKGASIVEVLKKQKIRKSHKALVDGALMAFHGHFGRVDEAMAVFNAISDCDKDAVCVGAALKALLKNERNEEAIAIYEAHKELSDNKSHVLALKAYANCGAQRSGEELIDSISVWHRENNAFLASRIIAFYGHFGEMKKAQRTFGALSAKTRNIACVNALMDGLCGAEQEFECLSLFERVAGDCAQGVHSAHSAARGRGGALLR